VAVCNAGSGERAPTFGQMSGLQSGRLHVNIRGVSRRTNDKHQVGLVFAIPFNFNLNPSGMRTGREELMLASNQYAKREVSIHVCNAVLDAA
jgi:hypothetical protein